MTHGNSVIFLLVLSLCMSVIASDFVCERCHTVALH